MTHKYTVPEVSSLSSQGSACALSAVIVFVCSVEPSEAVWGECVCEGVREVSVCVVWGVRGCGWGMSVCVRGCGWG